MSERIIRLAELKENDILTIRSEPRTRTVEGQRGTFDIQEIYVKARDGREGWVRLNATSFRNLLDKYGDDSSAWVDKDVRVKKGTVYMYGREITATFLEPIAEVLPEKPTKKEIVELPLETKKMIPAIVKQLSDLTELVKKTRADVALIYEEIVKLTRTEE